MGAIALIRKAERARDRREPNRTRIYNFVVPLKRNGECRIDTYAVKTRHKKTGELAIKKVARYYPAKARCDVRDILFSNFRHKYVVNWCNEPFGHKHQAVWEDVDAYIGVWGWDEANFKHCIDLHGGYLNGFEGTRYAKCGYDTSRVYGLHFMQYVECWNIDHSTEFLAKAGLWSLIRPTFIRKLSKDKGLHAFFRNHINEIVCRLAGAGICWSRYGVGAIEWAYRHNEPLGYAQDYLTYRGRMMRLDNIPDCVDRMRLFKYLRKNKVDPSTYDTYCHMLKRLDIDIEAYGYMFPAKWTRKYDEVDEAHMALIERERKEREKANRRRLAAERREEKKRLEHWKVICGYIDGNIIGKLYGGYEVVFLRDRKDLVAEGNAMRNCIGSYVRKVDEGRSLLLSLRAEDKPTVDVEINPHNFKVIQARYKGNDDAPQEIHDTARRIALDVKQGVETYKHTTRAKKLRRAA